jgi:anti-sigma factor RsiW
MNCNQVHQWTPLYLQRELDRAQVADFHAHLDSCVACSREIARQAELDGRLREQILAASPDSSAVEFRVRQTIASESRRRLFSTRRTAAAIAAMLLLALATIAATRMWFHPAPLQVCSDAARDHLREIVQREPRRWTSDVGGIDALGRRAGVSTAHIAAQSISGYQLERGKLCRLDGHVFLHLVYSDGIREFSLFLGSAGSADGSGGVYVSDSGGEHAATLQSGNERLIVVTGESSTAARDLARIAMQAL